MLTRQQRTLRHLRRRKRALGIVAASALFVHALVPRPPERTREAVAKWLAERAGGDVKPADVAWEPRGNLLAELVFGRGVWFLASHGANGARDLLRASVRLLPNGQPLSVSHAFNVTDTPDANETGLALDGSRVLYATVSTGRVTSLSVLEEAPWSGFWASLLARVRTGSWRPRARLDVFIDEPATSAAAHLDGGHLHVELGDGTRGLGVDLSSHTLRLEGGALAHAAFHQASRESAKLGAVGVSRALFGPALTALAGRAALAVAALTTKTVAPAAFAHSGELQWHSVSSAFLKPPLGVNPGAEGQRTPYLQRATLAPAGGARVELVGFGLDQVELGIVAGSEWPKASLGPPGEGRLPRDAERLTRVVAVFNAGPEAPYERYGTMTDGRLLVAPEPDQPGVFVTRAHRATLGSWPFERDVPSDVVSFTERSTALVSRGEAVSSADRSVRRRSALCMTAPSNYVYAYAEAVTPAAFAAALVHAGCDTALPLAASPEPLGFALADVKPDGVARFESLDARMDFDANATVRGSTRDFFYLAVRDVRPKSPPGVAWEADGGQQPEPIWLPGIVRGDLTLGGVTVSLESFEIGRMNFRLRPGPLEPGSKGQAWPGKLAYPHALDMAFASLELGHGTGAARYGLAVAKQIPLPLRPNYATLVVGNAEARILLPGEEVTLKGSEEAVQLPLLADDTDVTERARERGDSRPRAALGITEDGRMVVATLRHDSSDPLAVALRAAGCRRVVELDRGSHHPASLERTGGEHPPRAEPESTTLWVLRQLRF